MVTWLAAGVVWAKGLVRQQDGATQSDSGSITLAGLLGGDKGRAS